MKMTTLARPYANAAFEIANKANDLAAWEGMLNSASEIAKNADIQRLFLSPTVNGEQIAEVFIDILKPLLNEDRKHFIKLLSVNARLAALPDIFSLFKDQVAQQHKVVKAQVSSAVELDSVYKEKLSKALAKRMQREVELEYAINPEILGGVIVRAGDMVIDGSVRGKLTRLLESL